MELSFPISLRLGKKKLRKYYLNLNFYRNAHYQVLNQLKVKFSEEIKDQLTNLPQYSEISLTYTLYPQRLCDVMNVCTVVDKFFSDALVNYHVIDDDNINVIKNVSCKFGCIDKENPRVTVEIKGIEKCKSI